MRSTSSRLFCTAVVALALPALATCAAIEIDGTCYYGDCTNPDSIGYPGSTSGASNNSVMVNGATFDVSTVFLASFTSSGTSVIADPTVTYTGTTPLSSDETVTINVFQDFFYPGSDVTWDSTYGEHFPFILTSNGSADGELYIDGQGLGEIGPFTGPGTFSGSNSAYLSGLDGNTLGYDFQFTFTFDAGDLPGSSISSPSPIPEPVQTIPLAIALAGCALLVRRRSRRSQA